MDMDGAESMEILLSGVIADDGRTSRGMNFTRLTDF